MSTKNTIRRSYLIVKRALQGDYPNKRTLMSYLAQYDAKTSERTFQRDLYDIRSNFDIDILYDQEQMGYYINKDTAVDFDKLLYFIDLAEVSDISLSTIKNHKTQLQYISISPNPKVKGVEHIPYLLRAIQYCLEVEIEHYNYQTKTHKQYIIQPYLLKEFGGMWYVFGFVSSLGVYRTFGLDRFICLHVTECLFERKSDSPVQKFDQVYGLIYEPNNNPNASEELVQLRIAKSLIPYFQSLPLHATQSIENDILSLFVILNPELENKILSYGEHIEVLAPEALRTRIKSRISSALNLYL